MDRKLLIQTYAEYAPIEELADLLEVVKCEDCIHLGIIKGAVRGVMDAEPDEYYCRLGLEEYDDAGECEQGVRIK